MPTVVCKDRRARAFASAKAKSPAMAAHSSSYITSSLPRCTKASEMLVRKSAARK